MKKATTNIYVNVVLFNNGEIIAENHVFSQELMFIEYNDQPIHIVGPNFMKCNNCENQLGVAKYKWSSIKHNLRFLKHKIFGRKITIYIYRVVDENLKVINRKYENKYLTEKQEDSIEYKTNRNA